MFWVNFSSPINERENLKGQSIKTIGIYNRPRPKCLNFSSNLSLLLYNQNTGDKRDGKGKRIFNIHGIQ